MKRYEKGKVPHVIFGSGSAAEIGKRLKRYQIRNCLVISGSHVIQHPVTKKALQSLDDEGIDFSVYANVPAEPSDHVCMEIAALIRNHQFDCVLGIGGGSPMDAAKAAALIAGIPVEIEDLHVYGKTGNKMQEIWKRPCFLALMPTTSGTGAETTASAVISSVKHGLKFSFGNENISADLCVVDPEFTFGMPAAPTINGGLDALAHTVEILVGTEANEYTNAILFMCLRKIWKWLPVAVGEPDNREAREQLSWAAHNALANGGMPNGHAVAHALGSVYHIVHGRACAMVLPTVIRHFAESAQDAIAEIAQCIGVPVSGDARKDAEKTADAFLHFYQSLGVKMLHDILLEMNCTDDEEMFTKKMIPLVMDDFKSKQWIPPIHTGDYREKVGRICRMIYEER